MQRDQSRRIANIYMIGSLASTVDQTSLIKLLTPIKLVCQFKGPGSRKASAEQLKLDVE